MILISAGQGGPEVSSVQPPFPEEPGPVIGVSHNPMIFSFVLSCQKAWEKFCWLDATNCVGTIEPGTSQFFSPDFSPATTKEKVKRRRNKWPCENFAWLVSLVNFCKKITRKHHVHRSAQLHRTSNH